MMEVMQEEVCLSETSHPASGFVSDEEREQTIMAQMSMVKALAQSIHDKLPRHVEISDLLSAGVFGLMEAANRFDASLGVAFSTFAYNRVRGAILDGLRDEDFGSRKLRQQGRQLEAAITRLSTVFGRMPTEAEVASFLQISVNEYRSLAQNLWLLNIQSVDEEAEATDCDGEVINEILVNLIPDRTTLDQHSRLEQKEIIVQMHRAIESLPERQKTVISLYYYHEMTMSQIGVKIGVNESCVSKTHAKALLNLKASWQDAIKAAKSNLKETNLQPTADDHKPRQASHHVWGGLAACRKSA